MCVLQSLLPSPSLSLLSYFDVRLLTLDCDFDFGADFNGDGDGDVCTERDAVLERDVVARGDEGGNVVDNTETHCCYCCCCFTPQPLLLRAALKRLLIVSPLLFGYIRIS